MSVVLTRGTSDRAALATGVRRKLACSELELLQAVVTGMQHVNLLNTNSRL